MRVFVYGGKEGAARAAARGATAVVVDALRASATVTSLLEHGATEVLVVERTEEALAELPACPGAITVGERGGLRVEGFDRGNSPLLEPLPGGPAPIIFTSSNCSRCCLGCTGVPELYLGSTVNASALVALLRRSSGDIVLVPAGAIEDEMRLVREDYLACGLIIDRLGEAAEIGHDAAWMALTLFRAVGQAGLEEQFCAGDNGRRLIELGFERDVRLAAQVDIYHTVPRRVAMRELAGGGRGVVLEKAR